MKRLLFLIALLLTPTVALAQTSTLEAVQAYRTTHAAEMLNDFANLLAIPNVGSDSINIHRNAESISAAFEERGVQTEIWTQPGAPPIVYGEMMQPGAMRTLGIYVQMGAGRRKPLDPCAMAAYPLHRIDGGRRHAAPDA
ncbi:MAG TPA: hypothetical protein VKP65_22755 [Rhodothermales bacterium]|nr:hypothetical protein [Rhodothermales bacterium]